MVRPVHLTLRTDRRSLGPTVAVLGATSLLTALSVGSGLGAFGVVCGVLLAVVLAAALGRALGRAHQRSLTPADRVTLTRAILTVGVAASVAQSFVSEASTISIVVLASTALVLDGVDGRVARRTGTVHELGARFDMEIDALLIAVLSAYVATEVGWWVLGIGAAHYLLLFARRSWRWLRAPLPPRFWCKVVAALQGVMLTVAASGVLPGRLTAAMVGVGAALLAESFGREVWQLWQLHGDRQVDQGEVDRASRGGAIAVELGAQH